jgi:hypothetical protein
MQRYQVYLNKDAISILDDFQKYANISRSKLIREAIDRLAENLTKIFTARNIATKKILILDKLVGLINLKKEKETNFALKDDNSYLND